MNPILMMQAVIQGKSYGFGITLILFSIIGPIFNRAAQTMGARVKMDTFDLSCIEVKSSDLKGFIKSLQSVMSTLT